MKKFILTLFTALCLSGAAQAAGGEGVVWDKAPNMTNDLPALQSGAKLFVNYCQNCHAAAYMRFNRLNDIGLIQPRQPPGPLRTMRDWQPPK